MAKRDYVMYSCKRCHRTDFTRTNFLDEEIPTCKHCDLKMEKVGS